MPHMGGVGRGRFCRWCQKRFANMNVYDGHLNGKKHLKALEAGGQKGEADSIRVGATASADRVAMV